MPVRAGEIFSRVLGASLDVPRATLFGGIKVVDDAGLFQATVGFDF